MSLAKFIQYIEIGFLNEFWNALRPESQVFYDRGNQIFIFRELTQIFIISKNQLQTVVRIKIPHIGMIYSMNVQQDLLYVAYQTSENQLYLFSTKANRHFNYIVQTEKNSQIIQFEWAKGCMGLFDILVVENHGIHLLKIDDQVRRVKFLQQKISWCWYEPRNEVLATCSTHHNGLISTYYFKEKRKDFKFKGQDFYLEDFEPKEGTSAFASLFKSKKTDTQLFSAPTDKKNKDLSQDEQQSDSSYRVYLIYIYGKSLLAYSNSTTGHLLFYQLQYEKIPKKKHLLKFYPDSAVHLSVIDNLIVLSSFNEKVSIVFDVQIKKNPEDPLEKPQCILQQQETQTNKYQEVEKKQNIQQQQVIKENPQTESESAKKNSNKCLDDAQNDQAQNQSSVLKEEQQELDQKGDGKEGEEDESKQKQNQDQMEQQEQQDQGQNLIQNQHIQQNEEIQQYSSSQFIYDVQALIQEIRQSEEYYQTFQVKMKFHQLSQNLAQLKEEQSNIYEQSCNYQQDDLIINYKDKQIYQFKLILQHLPKIFNNQSEAFCVLLRRNNCKNAIFEFLIQLALTNEPIQLFSQIYKHILDIYLRSFQEKIGNVQVEKLQNEYTVLYPSDLANHFFKCLFEDGNMKKQFLIEILIEFIRQFQEKLKDYRIPINEIQNLLIKLLIKTNRYTQLHFLIQYQVLTDTPDFAKLLTEISSKEIIDQRNLQHYEPAFQLGADMYFRLQRYDELLEQLLKFGKFHDAAFLLKKIPNIRMKFEPIQHGIRYADCSKEDLVVFLEDAYRKLKTQFSGAEVKAL
ncbi:unnamed protein product (macronuclear) [Paramecium tetraurelia]|uniref:Uncharacterized protein n=1 Tax=Paramecium tetraurelia TaxID=5888 RepID=A0CUZ1_PARTE|nr:uncharacterized protein GSPATT00010776001 [Paramecium tetraurelia]CAK74608.1 unnamed protein product [Paramecium tetraurelia]|eukprot:XP_001442005.1 hypothetical protein (macronuclear) [Paramecium tetraurelia strain d4-2]